MIRGMLDRSVVIIAVLLLAVGSLTTAADGEAIRLIVRGDDMGSTQASNPAHIDCYQKGIMRTAEVMAVGPWFPETIRLLRENPGLDVGLHLALTSEWDNLKWRPLTRAPSLTDAAGWFFPMIWPTEHYGKDRALREQPWKLDEIEGELRAQIELTQRELPRLSHVGAHMGFTSIDERVNALVKRLAAEYGVDLDLEALAGDLKSLRWDGPKDTPTEKVETFARMMETLGPGTWLFIDHPAYDGPEMRAIHHVGYEDVALDRQGVVEAWTSPRVKEIVARRGIQLMSYRDFAEE
jgi:predicted glycoside hydrolase/deacetylase ChbG (UPF0249 family)